MRVISPEDPVCLQVGPMLIDDMAVSGTSSFAITGEFQAIIGIESAADMFAEMGAPAVTYHDPVTRSPPWIVEEHGCKSSNEPVGCFSNREAACFPEDYRHSEVRIMKMNSMKRVALMLLACLVALMPMAAFAEINGIEAGVSTIQKYGNIVLDISANALLDQGFAYGDIITVHIAGQDLDMPVGSNYSDVDNGNFICRVVEAENPSDSAVILAINMGDLATSLGIATKTKLEEDPGFRWDYNDGFDETLTVAIDLKEAGGYADEYMIHQLTRSQNRDDYPELSDEQYANFRNIATTGMGANVLYRSSSPVNPEINRNVEADAAVNAAGIQTVMNLADSEETMKGYEGFANTYYSELNVIPLNLGVDFTAPDFRAGLAEGFRFLASHEGPYLVHCTEGKDRAGYTSAVLECLMGATADEVIADYMVTYFNYYGVVEGTEQYDAIVRSNIAKSLATAFGVEDITAEGVDLAACAEAYLLECGMTQEEIDALKVNLGTSIE